MAWEQVRESKFWAAHGETIVFVSWLAMQEEPVDELERNPNSKELSFASESNNLTESPTLEGHAHVKFPIQPQNRRQL